MQRHRTQFLVTVTINNASEAPPAELQAAMSALIEADTRRGTFTVTGGLAPHSAGTRLTLSANGAGRSDARGPLHGFAVVEAQSLDEAIDVATRMLNLHQKYVPNWECEWEVRPIVTHCLP